VPDLGGEALEPSAGQRDRLEQLGVAVARHDLGRDRLGRQPEPRQHARLVSRAERRVGPDRAGDRARRGLRERALQPLGVAMGLEGEAGELEAERRRLRVDAVGAAHAQRGRVLPRPLGQRGDERARAGQDHLAGPPQLQGERGVEHVGGGQAVVDPAPRRAGRCTEHVDERGDVVVRDPLALLDRGDGERRGPDRLEIGLRRAVQGLRGGDLHVAPGGHAGLVGPDRSDLRPGVALDHGRNES
jgi:hypothetical protein